MTSDKFDHMTGEFLRDFLRIHPDVGTFIGIHAPYDWQLPNGGFKKLEDTRNLLGFWYNKMKEFETSDELSLDQKLSVRTLKLAMDSHEFSMVDYPVWKMNPDGIDLPGSTFFVMLTREYAPFDQRVSAMTSRMKRLPKYLNEFRSRFDNSQPVKEWTQLAKESAEQFPGFLKFIDAAAKQKVHDSLADDLTSAVKEAESALEEHVDWLDKLLEGPFAKFPMGKRKFAKLIKLRGLGLMPSEILSLGETYLKSFKEERVKVAEKIAPGKGVEGAMEVVRAKCGKTFEEALSMTEEEMNKAKQYIIEKDIATVDPHAVLRVVETPSFLASLLPYAALFQPAVFDPVQEGIYVVTRPKDPKDLGSHLNRAAIINTAVHEAYPGHFHQDVAANKRHWMLQIAAGGDTAMATETIEGWAHYCEKMMFDRGYEATDEAAFEMLNGAIWRACRIVADVKLAQGEATILDMTEFMVKEIGMTRDATEKEVLRYTHTPSQALSYMIGRHLILEFRKELETKMGANFNEKRFHDLVASYGLLPFALMKEAVVAGLGA